MNDNSFKQFRRSQIAELRPYLAGETMFGISVADVDTEAGSPKLGDMIARNPKNHRDQWLVAAQYFVDNFEPMPEDENQDVNPHEETSSRVSSLAAHYLGQNDRELEILIETDRAQVLKDIRSLAASCLTQDETPQPTSNFHDRLKIEREQLHEKLAKLEIYLAGPSNDTNQEVLLRTQARIMVEYLTILDKRLAALQAQPETAKEI